MLYEHEYMRAEFEWVACDSNDFVAYITTGGFGSLPSASIEDAERLEQILMAMKTLPRIGGVNPLGQVLNPPDWIDAVERGFYAYDWKQHAHRYELVAQPMMPIRLEQIADNEIRTLVARVRLPMSFRIARYISGDAEVDSP